MSESQKKEIERRSESIQSGTAKTVSWDLIESRFRLLNEHVEKVAKAKGISAEDIDAASSEHRRKQ